MEEQDRPGREYEASATAETRLARGKVTVEIKATFELDDARVFDLNGKGLTVAAVTSN